MERGMSVLSCLQTCAVLGFILLHPQYRAACKKLKIARSLGFFFSWDHEHRVLQCAFHISPGK